MLPLLAKVDELQEQLDPAQTYFGGGDVDSPFYFADQDLTNAYLMTDDSADVVRLDGGFSPVPPFAGVRRTQGLRCVGPSGEEPYLLHHILAKPWLASTRNNLYAQLLRRVLWDRDAAIRLTHDAVPPRLRPTGIGLIRPAACVAGRDNPVARPRRVRGRRLAGRGRRLTSLAARWKIG